jgi:hypothetical protein
MNVGRRKGILGMRAYAALFTFFLHIHALWKNPDSAAIFSAHVLNTFWVDVLDDSEYLTHGHHSIKLYKQTRKNLRLQSFMHTDLDHGNHHVIGNP